MMNVTFEGKIERFDDSLWSFHVKIPDSIYAEFSTRKIKRVLLSIDQGYQIHSGFMPAGNGVYFVMLNKENMKKMGLGLGQEVLVNLVEDTSKYGMPVSPEMEELLLQDPEGESYFQALTPGKIRSLLYLVNKVKSSDKRIEKSIIILEHLKANAGKLDYKMLNAAFKEGLNFDL